MIFKFYRESWALTFPCDRYLLPSGSDHQFGDATPQRVAGEIVQPGVRRSNPQTLDAQKFLKAAKMTFVTSDFY